MQNKKYIMAEDSKAIEDIDDIENVQNVEEKLNMLSMVKNLMESGRKKNIIIEIFDDSKNEIYPTAWGNVSQIATCRKCQKTGESIVKKKCGIWNSCCGCCFVLLCLWCFIPCLCYAACDIHHFCPYCKSPIGIKTFL